MIRPGCGSEHTHDYQHICYTYLWFGFLCRRREQSWPTNISGSIINTNRFSLLFFGNNRYKYNCCQINWLIQIQIDCIGPFLNSNKTLFGFQLFANNGNKLNTGISQYQFKDENMKLKTWASATMLQMCNNFHLEISLCYLFKV